MNSEIVVDYTKFANSLVKIFCVPCGLVADAFIEAPDMDGRNNIIINLCFDRYLKIMHGHGLDVVEHNTETFPQMMQDFVNMTIRRAIDINMTPSELGFGDLSWDQIKSIKVMG